MARHIEGPWFRASKRTWYATVGSKSISLGVRGEQNEAEARKAWHGLMAGTAPAGASVIPPPPLVQAVPTVANNTVTAQAVVDTFLADAAARVTTGCLRNYRLFLTPFCDRFGSRASSSLTPSEVEAFVRKPSWSTTYRANCLGAISTAFRFAVRERMIPTNPIPLLTRPPKRSRGADAVVSPAEFRKLVRHADDMMRDFMAVMWHTGARPGEVASLTVEMVQGASDGVVALVNHKTAHKGHGRLLILAGGARDAVDARLKVVKSGLLFPGAKGQTMSAQAIGGRMRTICQRAGIRRCIAYGFRHTYATQALSSGIPDATVAALMGHNSTTMLHKHYSHLTSNVTLLKNAAKVVRR